MPAKAVNINPTEELKSKGTCFQNINKLISNVPNVLKSTKIKEVMIAILVLDHRVDLAKISCFNDEFL